MALIILSPIDLADSISSSVEASDCEPDEGNVLNRANGSRVIEQLGNLGPVDLGPPGEKPPYRGS